MSTRCKDSEMVVVVAAAGEVTGAATGGATVASRATGEVTTELVEGTVRRRWGGTPRWPVGFGLEAAVDSVEAAVDLEVLHRWEAMLRWPVVDNSVVGSTPAEIEGMIEGTSAEHLSALNISRSWHGQRDVVLEPNGFPPLAT